MGNNMPASYPCQAVGCQHLVQPGFLMCMDHWRQVPSKLQNAVLTAYREVRRLGGDRAAIHQRYQAARQAAIDAVHSKQLAKKAGRDAASGSLF
jgi:hypothetical protein